MVYGFCIFCFRQKTSYECRISDCSSDVCSSDLETADRDARSLAAVAGDLDAGDALERLGDVLVGQLADVDRGHRIDELAAVALDRLRRGERGAQDRKSCAEGKCVLGGVDIGGHGIITKKNNPNS